MSKSESIAEVKSVLEAIQKSPQENHDESNHEERTWLSDPRVVGVGWQREGGDVDGRPDRAQRLSNLAGNCAVFSIETQVIGPGWARAEMTKMAQAEGNRRVYAENIGFKTGRRQRQSGGGRCHV